MNELHKGTPEQKAAAWEEAKEWLKVATTIDGPTLELPGIGLGYVFRWCRDHNIDTSSLQSVCVRHGLDPEDYIPPRGAKATDITLRCDLNLSDLLGHFNGDTIDDLTFKGGLQGSLGLDGGDWRFNYADYRCQGKQFRVHELSGMTTALDIAKFAVMDFKDIFGDRIELCDRWLEIITIDLEDKTVEFFFGT